jgi:hypothetical protein
MKPNPRSARLSRLVVALLAVLLAVLLAGRMPAASACPFCSAVSLTFSQEIAQSQVAVIARLVEPPTSASLSPRSDGPLPKGRFVVVEALKGGDLLEGAELLDVDGVRQIETIMLEVKPAGTTYLLMAVEPPKLVWSSPIPVSDRGIDYLKKLADLPAKGADRLAFFQKYLEDADDTLARDAYDEFAVAPYDDVRGLESRMDPTQLLAWIENPKVPANRRRLYATMLGVCGTKADADRIGAILANTEPDPASAEVRSGLDALIACYVTLKGPEGLDMVDTQFLDRKGRNVPFTETYAAVMALRFLGEESTVVPRERVLQSLRILLGEPKLADLVIADLARWEDWSVVDRLGELFEKADADNLFVREPVVNYLKACPDPHAAEVLAKLEKLDPEAVRRAATLAGFAAALAVPKPAEGAPAATESDGDPGDPSSQPGGAAPAVTSPPATEVSAAEAALAARIPPVLGDEDATDETVAIDPARVEAGGELKATPMAPAIVNGGSTPAANPWVSTLGRWCGVALLLAAVAVLSRMAMRSSGAA